MKKIAFFAKEEPQTAFSGYNIGLSQRRKYVQRAIAGIGYLFAPLEKAIRSDSSSHCKESDDERKLLSLPYRYGGLGLLNPCQTAQWEYNASKSITSDLSRLIIQQNMDFAQFDKEKSERN